MTGNQYITSFSCNLAAEKPSVIHENKYLKPTNDNTIIHWKFEIIKTTESTINNICDR